MVPTVSNCSRHDGSPHVIPPLAVMPVTGTHSTKLRSDGARVQIVWRSCGDHARAVLWRAMDRPAWELACHILPTIVFAAQRIFSLSVGAATDRRRPPYRTRGARLLTLPPTGGNAGYVGKSHRGMSRGWTICLVPGHRAVARRGVLTQWTWQCTPPPPGPNTTG
jgi:hypothetical protein